MSESDKEKQYHNVDLQLLTKHKGIMLGNYNHLSKDCNTVILRRLLRSAMIVGSIIGTNKAINREIKKELKWITKYGDQEI